MVLGTLLVISAHLTHVILIYQYWKIINYS